ncbi:MAG: GNAT family N-acetyltransferase [Micromonosporaceae bacterium]|nr:GNAT family N-acetyltransferase [Micromonosporaceae bacterium]
MTREGASKSQPDVEIIEAKGHQADIDAAVQLGNRHSATLGFLPEAVYYKSARDGTLVLARVNGEVVGYALYGLARRHAFVRLTHLCVAQQYRGLGIARRLVDYISERHAEYRGIRARCRHDYGLGGMWIKLGFRRVSEQVSRGKGDHRLVNWWRSHGHPDLFTRVDGEVLVRAAVDLNIVRDLVDSSRRDTRDVLALVDDQISDRLELVRTAALDAEIDSIEGNSLRGSCTRLAQTMTPVPASEAASSAVRSQLLTVAQSTIEGFPRDTQDQFDLQHVADAAAAGLNVFVTRDEQLLRTFAVAAEEMFGLRILRPVDVVLHIDELVRAEAYRPVALHDTSYRRQLLGVGHDAAIDSLLSTETGERQREFRAYIRDLTIQGHNRFGLFGPDNALIAAYCTYNLEGQLLVPLLRIRSSSIQDTLARQLLFVLRQLAVETGSDVIQITDPHLSRAVRLAAADDGFRSVESRLVGYTIDVCGTADEVNRLSVAAARRAGLPEPPLVRSGMPAVAAAEVERSWWPAKVVDSELPTYVVPIQQVFASDLLGVPETVLPRHDFLGISREHVYYRSATGVTPKAPARILWYMSKTSASGGLVPYPSGIIACSRLDAVTISTPSDLHSRFRHLGVWRLDQVVGAAKSDRAQALLFGNTEVFPRHVSLKRLRVLGEAFGGFVTPQQPREISSQLFAEIYTEGRKGVG